jgi:hypothetical protein
MYPHVPADPLLLQYSHDPSQARSQQTVSAQLLLKHSLFPPHVCPAFFLQAPAASQVLVPLQLSGSSALMIATQVPPVPVQAWHVPHAAPVQQ